MKDLELITQDPIFWNSNEDTNKVLSRIKQLKSKIEKYNNIYNEVNNLLELSELLKIENDDEMAIDLVKSTKKVNKEYENLELETLFSGTYDGFRAPLPALQRKILFCRL